LELPSDVSYEEGCSAFVNPLTVISFLEIANTKGCKTIVHTAAASQLGKMLLRIAPHYGVEVICTVRKAEQIDEIVRAVPSAKRDLILLSTDAKFDDSLRELAKQKKATLAFDAIAGDSTTQLLKALPNNSDVYVYGGLSGRPVASFDAGEVLTTGKTVRGFYLPLYLGRKSLMGKAAMIRSVRKHLKNELRTEVAAAYPLEETADAFVDYIQNMTAGKITIAPTVEKRVLNKHQ